jgi:Tol biopolymer transport system component
MLTPRRVKFRGLVCFAVLAFSSLGAKAQSLVEKGTETSSLFAARGIERIVYMIERRDALGIWISEIHEVTKSHPMPKALWEFEAGDPSYSPDGKKIAFNLGNHGRSSGIYMMEAGSKSGAELQVQHSPGFVTHIAWSHDGTKLAFSASQGAKDRIFEMNPDGSEMRLIVDGSSPNWSMDDKELVFERGTEAGGKFTDAIWVANADGSNAHMLTKNKSRQMFPSWLPNGRGILFAAELQVKSAVYAMDGSGGNVRLIMRSDKYHLSAPTISPDGKTLVCDMAEHQVDSSKSHVWIVPLDGKGQAVSLTSGYKASVVWTAQEVRPEAPPTAVTP